MDMNDELLAFDEMCVQDLIFGKYFHSKINDLVYRNQYRYNVAEAI